MFCERVCYFVLGHFIFCCAILLTAVLTFDCYNFCFKGIVGREKTILLPLQSIALRGRRQGQQVH